MGLDYQLLFVICLLDRSRDSCRTYRTQLLETFLYLESFLHRSRSCNFNLFDISDVIFLTSKSALNYFFFEFVISFFLICHFLLHIFPYF